MTYNIKETKSRLSPIITLKANVTIRVYGDAGHSVLSQETNAPELSMSPCFRGARVFNERR